MKKLKPLGARVLLRRISSEKQTPGGIVIPDTATKKPKQAKVVSLGTGGKDEDGNEIEFSVAEGDHVLISEYGGTDVTIDGEEHVVVKLEDILAIVDP